MDAATFLCSILSQIAFCNCSYRGSFAIAEVRAILPYTMGDGTESEHEHGEEEKEVELLVKYI